MPIQSRITAASLEDFVTPEAKDLWKVMDKKQYLSMIRMWMNKEQK